MNAEQIFCKRMVDGIKQLGLPFNDRYVMDAWKVFRIVAVHSGLPEEQFIPFLEKITFLLTGNFPETDLDLTNPEKMREFLGFTPNSTPDGPYRVYLDVQFLTWRERIVAALHQCLRGQGYIKFEIDHLVEKLSEMTPSEVDGGYTTVGIIGSSCDPHREYAKQSARSNPQHHATTIKSHHEKTRAITQRVFSAVNFAAVFVDLFAVPEHDTEGQPFTHESKNKMLELLEAFIDVISRSIGPMGHGGSVLCVGYLKMKASAAVGTFNTSWNTVYLHLEEQRRSNGGTSDLDTNGMNVKDFEIYTLVCDSTEMQDLMLMMLEVQVLLPEVEWIYDEYNNNRAEPKTLFDKMARTGASVSIGGAREISIRWEMPRTWEEENKTAHAATVERITGELVVHFVELSITDVFFLQHVHVLACVTDLLLEGKGKASTMHRTIAQSILDAIVAIKRIFPTIQLVRGTRYYKDNDVEQPYLEDPFGNDMSNYLAADTIVYYIDSCSLRDSRFPMYAAIRSQGGSNNGMRRRNVDYSDLRSVDLGSRLACAVRARCGEIHDIPIYVVVNGAEGRVALRSVFVSVQIHLHCWGVMSLILPWSKLNEM